MARSFVIIRMNIRSQQAWTLAVFFILLGSACKPRSIVNTVRNNAVSICNGTLQFSMEIRTQSIILTGFRFLWELCTHLHNDPKRKVAFSNFTDNPCCLKPLENSSTRRSDKRKQLHPHGLLLAGYTLSSDSSYPVRQVQMYRGRRLRKPILYSHCVATYSYL